MATTGNRLIIEALKREKVDVVFGYPGGAVIPIFDALFAEDQIRVILTRHEQGAVHAADGYARVTGKVGVCIVTSGPGATNTVTGLATANFDSVPIVCIAGQVPRAMIGNEAFQEADTSGVTRPVTKHNYLVTERDDLGRMLREAFHIARTGRPGPVVVDIPTDVIKAEGTGYPSTITIRGYNPVVKGHTGQIKRAAKAIDRSKRPLFYIGGGLHISGACEVFRRIAEHTGIPTVSSLMGLGALSGDCPLHLGMLGMHGTYTANMAVQNCDLLFGIGNRFDDRATGLLEGFAPNARIVHIDVDPVTISRNIPVEIPIVGDARAVLEELEPLLTPPSIEPWKKQVQQWQEEHPVPQEPDGDGLSPTRVVRTISDLFPDAIIATEVGQNQMWTALHYTFRHPRSFITSGGLGTMGYGFPAAIGAQIAEPDKMVIDIAGDGSIQMNIQELAVACLQRLPVMIVILNNGYLGMVRQWQELFYERRYAETCLHKGPDCPHQCKGERREACPAYTPDFVKLAEAYGARGLRITAAEDLEEKLKDAAQTRDRPVVVEVIVDREADVFPMVPAGKPLDQMILSKEESP